MALHLEALVRMGRLEEYLGNFCTHRQAAIALGCWHLVSSCCSALCWRTDLHEAAVGLMWSCGCVSLPAFAKRSEARASEPLLCIPQRCHLGGRGHAPRTALPNRAANLSGSSRSLCSFCIRVNDPQAHLFSLTSISRSVAKAPVECCEKPLCHSCFLFDRVVTVFPSLIS